MSPGRLFTTRAVPVGMRELTFRNGRVVAVDPDDEDGEECSDGD